MPKTSWSKQHSESLPLFAWTRAAVETWMRITTASILPRLIGLPRDLFVDLYLIFMVPVLLGVLLLWRLVQESAWLAWLPVAGVVLAVWMLQEIACVTLFDLVRREPIRGRKRWMLATLPTVVHVVLCFAILFLTVGSHFTPPVNDWLTAVYLSMTTFGTLGYGDIHPTYGSAWGMAIVICEQAMFLLLVVIRVPMAVSMLRVEDLEDTAQGRDGGARSG